MSVLYLIIVNLLFEVNWFLFVFLLVCCFVFFELFGMFRVFEDEELEEWDYGWVYIWVVFLYIWIFFILVIGEVIFCCIVLVNLGGYFSWILFFFVIFIVKFMYLCFSKVYKKFWKYLKFFFFKVFWSLLIVWILFFRVVVLMFFLLMLVNFWMLGKIFKGFIKCFFNKGYIFFINLKWFIFNLLKWGFVWVKLEMYFYYLYFVNIVFGYDFIFVFNNWNFLVCGGYICIIEGVG